MSQDATPEGFGPEDVREKLFDPLSLAVSQLAVSLAKFERLVSHKKVPEGRLPLRLKAAMDAVISINAAKGQMNALIERIEDGTYERTYKRRVSKRQQRGGKVES